jgi:outer membrane biosynthesis protein TonB
MRSRLWLPLLATALSGCASLSDLLVPAPVTPPLRSAVVEDEPAPPAKPAPVAKEPTPAQPQPAVPLAKEPPAGPTPVPTPTPQPPRTASIPRETPAPVLAPKASAEEEQRIKNQAERRIEGTERLVHKIDPSRLAREQQENYLTIQSFLAKAREALASRDVQRAFTLADKAFLLADELSKVPR